METTSSFSNPKKTSLQKGKRPRGKRAGKKHKKIGSSGNGNVSPTGMNNAYSSSSSFQRGVKNRYKEERPNSAGNNNSNVNNKWRKTLSPAVQSENKEDDSRGKPTNIMNGKNKNLLHPQKFIVADTPTSSTTHHEEIMNGHAATSPGVNHRRRKRGGRKRRHTTQERTGLLEKQQLRSAPTSTTTWSALEKEWFLTTMVKTTDETGGGYRWS